MYICVHMYILHPVAGASAQIEAVRSQVCDEEEVHVEACGEQNADY